MNRKVIAPTSRSTRIFPRSPRQNRELVSLVTTRLILGDDNTGIFHVFEMQIAVNEFDYLILALLKQ